MAVNNQIIVSSVNCRGLSIKKQSKLLNALDYIKNTNANIVCLQETHWIDSNIRDLKKYINYDIYINGQFTNKRGVAIMIAPNFEYKVLDIIKDVESRVLVLDLLIENDFSIRLINIYAPNQDKPEFYSYIQELYESSDTTYTIITGDFNLTLDPIKDSVNYANINNPKSREIVLELLANQDLVDAYRHLYPSKREYTWKKKTPIKKARLDYFLVSSALIDLVSKSQIIPTIDWTDHSFITLNITTNQFTRGKGTWKLNCNLLYNQTYIDLINKTIEETKLEYSVSLYNRDIRDIENNLIQFTISDKLFLDMLLLNIRGKSIKFASQLKRDDNEKEKVLISDIQTLENNPSLSQLTELIQDKKQELKQIRDKRLQGNFVRSRVQYLKDGEKPTKYFCALESHNFVNKTIKKLKIDDHDITNQQEILKEVESFYTRLFANSDHVLTDTNIDTLLSPSLNNVTKLSEDDKMSIESPITLDEVAKTLYKMNNNKTPGNDGFPCEFYKMFWSKLKHFILRSIAETYHDRKLMITSRQCQITCLPKGDKARESLKNWRPISLLNVTYKLISATLANRLKTVLPKIISKAQTGFLENRFIGESTRLIYDIMAYVEEHDQPGLLMLIDFEKAFDSVSWRFLYKTFDFFNFGSYIQTWIKILNNDITATVQQSGFNSPPFPISRGCRQGDPIASYEFLLCAQILYLLIMQNKEIKGIDINQYEHKLTQFADDTTLIMDGSQDSLQASLNTLEIFGSISGLKINKDKTKIVWIGKKRNSDDILPTIPPLQWGLTEFDLLGLSFSTNMNKIVDLNYNKYLPIITNTIKQWNKRLLTPLGKITIIKTFLISKLIHLFTSLPTPPEVFIKKIEKEIYQFLWDKKPDKISRKQVIQNYNSAGLKMLDINNFIKSLKISWFRRLLENNDSPWAHLFTNTITPVNALFELGNLNTLSAANKTSNKFWQSALLALHDYQSNISLKEPHNILNIPLWLNSNISQQPLFVQSWYNKGIKTIGDILDLNYEILKQEDIANIYNARTDFLTYLRIKISVKEYLTSILVTEIKNLSFNRPYIPYLLAKLRMNKKNIYKTLISPETQPLFYNLKWEIDLGHQIDPQTFSNAFRICFNSNHDNYLKWHQYKTLTRILGIKSSLHKMKIKDDSDCRLCKINEETIIHIYTQCTKVTPIWIHLSKWIFNKLRININFDPTTIILGYLHKNNYALPVNMIISETKSYIFWCCRNELHPNLLDVQTRILERYKEYKQLSILKCTIEDFSKTWNVWKRLF